MKQLIEDFLNNELPKLISSDSIYNEFSLQHELGIYLRAKTNTKSAFLNL